MKSIRVLMITSEWPEPGISHTPHFIKRQAEFLRAAGVEVDVFHFAGEKNPLNYLKAWVAVRRKTRHSQYDLIHAQFGQSGLLALPKPAPLVVTFRGSDLLGTLSDKSGRYLWASFIHRRLSRLVARCADAVILVSEHMKRELHPSIATQVIPSGIDFEVFHRLPKEKARRQLGLPLDEKLVLFVGRPTSARKRAFLAKQSMDLLNRSMPARLVVAWRVSQSDIMLYMNACDALVFTSRQEGSPNVVKEALACDLPVVSVRVGDVALRLLGIEGCEICEDAPEAIAAALERVLKRTAPIEGRQAVENLDEKLTTVEVLKVYSSVIAGQTASSQAQAIDTLPEAIR